MKARVRFRLPATGTRPIASDPASWLFRMDSTSISLLRFGITCRTPGRAAAASGSRLDQQPVTTTAAPALICLAYLLARIRCRRTGHRAGIHDHQVSFCRRGNQVVPGSTKVPGVSFDLRLIQPATHHIKVNVHGTVTMKLSKKISTPAWEYVPANTPTLPLTNPSPLAVATSRSLT